MREIPVLVWKEDSDTYVSLCPATSVSSYGNTEEETIKHHIEAVKLYLEDMSKEEIDDIFDLVPASTHSTKICLDNIHI